MRRGAWHQFGYNSQRLVIEQIQNGAGVGVVISPRDLGMGHAIAYSQRYHDLDAHVLFDPQFYVPSFSNTKMETYPTNLTRTTISQTHQITDPLLVVMVKALHAVNSSLSADGLIAPALIYEAGRPDIMQLNGRLFSAAKQVGNVLGIPTYATVIIGNSAVASNQTTKEILSHATSLNSDGFYYSF